MPFDKKKLRLNLKKKELTTVFDKLKNIIIASIQLHHQIKTKTRLFKKSKLVIILKSNTRLFDEAILLIAALIY